MFIHIFDFLFFYLSLIVLFSSLLNFIAIVCKDFGISIFKKFPALDLFSCIGDFCLFILGGIGCLTGIGFVMLG